MGRQSLDARTLDDPYYPYRKASDFYHHAEDIALLGEMGFKVFRMSVAWSRILDGNLVGGTRNPYLTMTDWGWQIDPVGLRWTLGEIYGRYHIPLMVVKNGLGANDVLTEDGHVHDDYRIDYLRRHIQVMKDAIEQDGIDLIGYTSWRREREPA